MRTRLLVGIPLALGLTALLVLDGWLAADWRPAAGPTSGPAELRAWLHNGAICAGVVLVLTVLAAYELVCIARARGYRPFGGTAVVFAAVLVLAPYVSSNMRGLTGPYDESWGLLWLATALAYVFLQQAVRRRTEHAMENIAITVFIILYVGGLASFMTKLRMEIGGSTGVVVLLFSTLLVKMTDTGAYFTGRALGRHKMIEWLSPKKTWEGFVGGMVTTVVLAVLLGHWLHTSGLVRIDERALRYPWVLLLLGLVLGLVSVGGDLCASLLKRDAQIKDSGALPGLGGVLDIVDSPLLAAPAAWLFWTRLFHVVA